MSRMETLSLWPEARWRRILMTTTFPGRSARWIPDMAWPTCPMVERYNLFDAIKTLQLYFRRLKLLNTRCFVWSQSVTCAKMCTRCKTQTIWFLPVHVCILYIVYYMYLYVYYTWEDLKNNHSRPLLWKMLFQGSLLMEQYLWIKSKSIYSSFAFLLHQ